MKYLKLTIIFALIFAIFYFEPITIGEAIKFSHLWKTLFVAIMALLIVINLPFVRTHERPKPYTLFAGYCYALYPLLMCFFIAQPFDGIFLTFQRLFYVLFIHYLVIRNYSNEQLTRFLLYSVIFVALSTLPFQLNLLTPLGKGYDLSILGVFEPGFVGVFQNAHSASLALSLCALLAILLFIQSKSKRLKISYVVLIIYLLFVLITTYARAGFAVFIMGLFCYGMLSRTFKKRIKFIIVASAVTLLLIYNLIDTNLLMNRVLGRTIYSQDTSVNIDRLGSGRLTFASAAIEIYIEATPLESLVGIGETELRNRMYRKTGMAVFAHNGFINEIVVNGLLGFLIMLFFLRNVFRDIQSIQEPALKMMGLSIYAGFLTFILFQGGEFPTTYLLLAPFILFAYAPQSNYKTS